MPTKKPTAKATDQLVGAVDDLLDQLFTAEQLLGAAAYAWLEEGNSTASKDGSYSTMDNAFLHLAERVVLAAETG